MDLAPGGDDPMRPNNHKINEGANKATLVPRQYENHPDSVEYDRTPLSYRYLTRLFPDGIGDALYPYQFQHLYQQHRPPPVLAEEWYGFNSPDVSSLYQAWPNTNNYRSQPRAMVMIASEDRKSHTFEYSQRTQTGDGPKDYEDIYARDDKNMCSIQ